MEFIRLISGFALIVIFGWILVRNRNRSGFLHGLLRLDMLVGVIAGLYLIVTALVSILGYQ